MTDDAISRRRFLGTAGVAALAAASLARAATAPSPGASPAASSGIPRRPLAADGRFELYETSKQFDRPPGRAQHGFPAKGELEA